MSGKPKIQADNQEWKDEAVKVLGELAHSLRNPFATVQSYLNILEMEDYRLDSEELKLVSSSLHETVQKSLKMIDEKVLALRETLTKI